MRSSLACDNVSPEIQESEGVRLATDKGAWSKDLYQCENKTTASLRNRVVHQLQHNYTGRRWHEPPACIPRRPHDMLGLLTWQIWKR